MLPFDQTSGFFFLLFFWRSRGELLLLCRRKFSLAVAVHWVARSGKCRCSDSVCLPDYLKVTLFQRANRRTSFCFGLYSLLCPCRKLRRDTVEAFHHLAGQWQAFSRPVPRIGALKAKRFRFGKKWILERNISGILLLVPNRSSISPRCNNLLLFGLPKVLPLYNSGLPPLAALQ